LKDAFSSHLEETQGQVLRLEKVFEMLGERARGKHCAGIAGIIEEGAAIMEEDFDETAMDASLIAGGQRAEHYEIAAYGSLVAWARELGHMEVGEMLQETLNEEKTADELLSALAQARVNQDAAEIAIDEDTDTELPPAKEPARLWSKPKATRAARMSTVISESGFRRRAGR
jgi:ferritin-like metal-binding protein YciE